MKRVSSVRVAVRLTGNVRWCHQVAGAGARAKRQRARARARTRKGEEEGDSNSGDALRGVRVSVRIDCVLHACVFSRGGCTAIQRCPKQVRSSRRRWAHGGSTAQHGAGGGSGSADAPLAPRALWAPRVSMPLRSAARRQTCAEAVFDHRFRGAVISTRTLRKREFAEESTTTTNAHGKGRRRYIVRQLFGE
jgi:hypothetical protein